MMPYPVLQQFLTIIGALTVLGIFLTTMELLGEWYRGKGRVGPPPPNKPKRVRHLKLHESATRKAG